MDELLFLDSNNNSSGGGGGGGDGQSPAAPSKYSLRPRALQRRRLHDDDDLSSSAATATRTSAASLRRGAGAARCKQKPPPLSKYRRKTANARERDRMREINAAFETLRRAVPPHDPAAPDHLSQQQQQQQDHGVGEKLTKITTLRLAMRYIAALTHALEAASNGGGGTTTPSQQQQDLAAPPASVSPPMLLSLALPPPAVGVDLTSDGESLETFHSDLSGGCLTPPHSADFVVPDFGDSLTPPPDYFVTHSGVGGGGAGHHGLQHFCLTPPPGFEDHCCLLAPP